MESYDVWTDLNPDELSEVGYQVMLRWVAFAMGKTTIHGRRVAHPTGRYASSITVERHGPTHIAIVSDEELAPEAHYLEVGHGRIDLKEYLTRGKTYPMHRGARGSYGSRGYGPAVLGSSLSPPSIWATPRARGASGFATVPSEVTAENANSWIIPAMAAWAPARYLADMLRKGEFNAA